MKLKDYLSIEDETRTNLHKKYEDFLSDENEMPLNSIEIGEDGTIHRNQHSLLRYIQFLLSQYDYVPEKKNCNKPNKKKKPKSKPNSQLKSKGRKKIIKKMDDFSHGHSNYPDDYGNIEYYR